MRHTSLPRGEPDIEALHPAIVTGTAWPHAKPGVGPACTNGETPRRAGAGSEENVDERVRDDRGKPRVTVAL